MRDDDRHARTTSASYLEACDWLVALFICALTPILPRTKPLAPILDLGITMPSRAAPVELDFLGIRADAADAGEHHSKSNGSSSSSSIRGMETSAIARIDPQLLRRVVVARPPPPEKEDAAAPMTVFYNGSVAIFDVSRIKAEAIMRMAAEVTTLERCGRGNALAGNFAKDIPLARTKSLQQFLVKRKERLTRLGPYQIAVGATTTSSNKSSRVKKEAEEA